MSHSSRRWIVFALLSFVFLVTPDRAYADNCGSLRDCYGTIFSGILAFVAIAGIVALAFAFAGLVPFIFESIEASEFFPWLQGINAVGGTTNCAMCSLAVDAQFDGVATVAGMGPPAQIGSLESTCGSLFNNASITDIESQLILRGPGSRGIVYVEDVGNQVAHVFNAVNVDGRVWYIDGQIAYATTNSASMLSATGYTQQGMMFMLTN